MIFSKEIAKLGNAERMIQSFSDELKPVVLKGKKDIIEELGLALEHLKTAKEIMEKSVKKR